MRAWTDYSYNYRMSTSYRSTRNKRWAYFPATESTGAPEQPLPRLAPDIITARERPPPSANGSGAPAQRRDAPGDLSIIEARHPDIARAISLLWGFPEMNEYFDRLWLSDTFHAPIDPDAMSELMLLARVHQAVLPQRPNRSLAAIYGSSGLHGPSSNSRDPWGDVPPRR
ncbi:hypothetical protein SBBP1_530031 [Burkholderiales bacterium]|nr:hypothetical protein SBBP1_530031 [Burkholderiales bacterium]